MQASRSPAPVSWTFPLPRTHTGIPFGNGRSGCLLWGAGRRLRATLGRADFWDHRGGMPWTGKQSYARIRAALEAGDEPALRALFANPAASVPGQPARPTVLPVGVVAFDLGPGRRLLSAALDPASGQVALRVRTGRAVRTIQAAFDLKRGALVLRWPRGLAPRAEGIPAWRQVGEKLAAVSFQPPVPFGGDGGGWVQTCPADPALAAGWLNAAGCTAVATARGGTVTDARRALEENLQHVLERGFRGVADESAAWWRRYWADVPALCIPSERLRILHDYGMYRFAGLTHPGGVAATLQGPWIEEYQLPPWSSDYHFNINVQLCYGPAYRGNRLEHLKPLFAMIRSWWPVLRHNARVFLGIDDGFMLPHAVDDRCTCMGGFWSGCVDHGCTAWMADLMFRYVRFSGDLDFLRSDAFPFLKGAMRVYQAMFEEHAGRLSLPVSVSPEYRGCALNAWGRDASFQLACAHRLAENLLEAARLLGVAPDPAWETVRRRLPMATLAGEPGREMIALWEGVVLEYSHRHHSHLAALVPFDLIDPDEPQWRGIVERTVTHWLRQGPALWSGWCVPWASMLQTHLGNAEAAELWLETWERVFTNEGYGTLHDAAFPGFSLMGQGATGPLRPDAAEVMQMDAGMGCVTAIHEMLLHEIRGVHHVFRGAPARWREARFDRLRAAGGFLVGATRREGRTTEVRLRATRAGTFVLASPWPGRAAVLRQGPRGERVLLPPGPCFEITLPAGARAVVRPRPALPRPATGAGRARGIHRGSRGR